MKPRLSLNIVGAGRVGRTLGRCWAESGIFEIQDVSGRSLERAREAAAFIGAGRPVGGLDGLRAADVTLIGVPDDRIAETCARLGQAGLLPAASIVFHCSGALRSSDMPAAVAAGAAVAGVHPIRSFAVPEQVAQSFAGTWCGIEGDGRALAVLEPAFKAIGARTVRIDAGHKMLYHSAAVFASNYLVTLIDTSLRTYEKASIPREIGLQMLEPLVRKTVDDVFRIGPEQALQGPIARGDKATVEKQYKAVSAWNRRIGALYARLAALTADLAARRRNGR